MSTHPESAGAAGPSTPAATVIGWVVVAFTIIPLTMGVHGDGQVYLVTGLAGAVLGAGLVVAGRFMRRR